jgi:hypothetical protein
MTLLLALEASDLPGLHLRRRILGRLRCQALDTERAQETGRSSVWRATSGERGLWARTTC